MADSEFIEAIQQLAKDPQLIHLTMSKLAGWLLLTPIQLASRHPATKDLTTIKEAVKFGKAIQPLIVEDSEVLLDVANCGWKGTESKTPFNRFRAEFANLKHTDIKIELTKLQAWSIISACQLAHRHPGYKNTPSAQYNKDLLAQLEAAIPEGILLVLLKSGWDTRLDRPINKKGFGKL